MSLIPALLFFYVLKPIRDISPYGYRASKNRGVRWYITGLIKMTEQQKKKEYNAPIVEQIEARVEKGFTMSGAVEAGPSGGTETLSNSGNTYDGNAFD